MYLIYCISIVQDHIPSQVNPSPKCGGIQAQVKVVELPDTLAQVALT